MRTFGLIGFPLTHSFSKKFFTEKFHNEHISNCRYELFPIESIDELHMVFEQNPALEGLNVTIPYKKQVIAFLDEATDAVQQMQACNCIAIKDGKRYGFNTDTAGFEQTFAPHLQAHHTKALVLGTGGAAAAVTYTLRKLGIEYCLVSRQAAATSISYDQVDANVINEFPVIINTTPLGTYPAVEGCPPLPYDCLTEKHYLYDLVYNPPETEFLKRGKAKGATTENGAKMLIIQAEESWKIWNDFL